MAVVQDCSAEVRRRVAEGLGVLPAERRPHLLGEPRGRSCAMNLLEDPGGRVCGSEYLFCHAIGPIPEDLPTPGGPGPHGAGRPHGRLGGDRAEHIGREIAALGAEARDRLANPRGQPLRGGRGRCIGEMRQAQLRAPACWKSKCRRLPTRSSPPCARGWKPCVETG